MHEEDQADVRMLPCRYVARVGSASDSAVVARVGCDSETARISQGINNSSLTVSARTSSNPTRRRVVGVHFKNV